MVHHRLILTPACRVATSDAGQGAKPGAGRDSRRAAAHVVAAGGRVHAAPRAELLCECLACDPLCFAPLVFLLASLLLLPLLLPLLLLAICAECVRVVV